MADERPREADAQDSDLGLRSGAPSQIRRRILEKNGNFNVVRRGLNFWSQAEVTILITGMDETFSQIVHARSSYGAEEIIEGARFVRMFRLSDDGRTEIDIRRLDEHEPADLP